MDTDDRTDQGSKPYRREEPAAEDAGPEEAFPRSSAVAGLMRKGLQGMAFDALLDETCRITSEILDVEYCHVFELRPAHGDLILRAGVRWPEEYKGSITMDASPTSQNGYTVRSWEPTVVQDIQDEDRFEPSDVMEKMGIVSGVSVVIPAPIEPWGVFGAHSTKPRAFDELDTTFVQSMGQVLSEAVSMRRVEEEKDRYQQRLEHFAYTASHDLQEPLRMVSSYLQLIEDRYGEMLDEEGQEFFAFATEGAQRMRRMVKSLLQITEITTDTRPLEPVDANTVLEDALSDLELKIQDTDAKITASTLPTVQADPQQLSRVFQNLVSNALKYSGDKPPRIHVDATRTGDAWRFSVEDEGIGIDPQDRDKIFNVFHRLHGREESDRGIGIGLAICEEIVDRHGGRMWVESNPGEGSTFFFTMPAPDPDDDAA